MKKQLTIEFGGFYGSIHEDQIDYQIEIHEVDFETVDYQKTKINDAKAYLKELEQYILDEYEITTNFGFLEINSPREYNFTTDKILAECVEDRPTRQLTAVLMMNDDFLELARDMTTERSGFMPFYSYGQAIANKANILEELALRFVCYQLNQDLEQLEFDLEIL